jgi:hypothetical protein
MIQNLQSRIESKISLLLLTVLLFIGITKPLNGQVNIDLNKVIEAGKIYLINSDAKFRDSKSNQIRLSLTETQMYNDTVLYYVFNINENDGYLIMTANENLPPVIAYVPETRYSLNAAKSSPALINLLNTYQTNILFLIRNRTKNLEATSMWDFLAGKGDTEIERYLL